MPSSTQRSALRRWLDARPGRRVVLAGVAFVLVQAAVRAWVKLRGWFVVDDLAFIAQAQTDPLTPGWFFRDWNGHFMPGSFAVVRLTNHLWPFDWTAVALVDVALQALLGVLVLALFLELFGRRVEVLVPYAVFVFSAITLPAFLWWAAALNQLWGQLAMVTALLCHVRFHRSGRRLWQAGTVAAVVVGLMFSEKVVLVAPVLLLLTLFWFTPGRRWPKVAGALRAAPHLWVALAGTLLAYAVARALVVRTGPQPPTGVELVVDTIGVGLFRGVLPGLLGGPLHWGQVPYGGYADPSLTVIVATTLAATLVGVVTVWFRRRAILAWTLAGLYFLSTMAILVVGRAQQFGPMVAVEYRYVTDLCLVAALCAGLASLPIRGAAKVGTVQRIEPRRSQHRSDPLLDVLSTPSARALGSATAVCVLAVPSLVSNVSYAPYWEQPRTREYFSHLRTSLAQADGPVDLVDQRIGFFPETTTSRLLTQAQPTPRFLTKGRSASTVFVPDSDGYLRRAQVEGIRGRQGPHETCGWLVGPQPQSIPLQRQTFPWLWGVQIGYLASHDADAVVQVGSVRTPVRVRAGVHHLFVLGEGAVDTVRISDLSYGTLCTNDVQVGGFTPIPGTGPGDLRGGRL